MNLPTTACRSCGAAMIWARNPRTGKNVPLDATAPVYQVILSPEDGRPEIVEALEGAYVSHFKTCPHAAQHSRSRKR